MDRSAQQTHPITTSILHVTFESCRLSSYFCSYSPKSLLHTGWRSQFARSPETQQVRPSPLPVTDCGRDKMCLPLSVCVSQSSLPSSGFPPFSLRPPRHESGCAGPSIGSQNAGCLVSIPMYPSSRKRQFGNSPSSDKQHSKPAPPRHRSSTVKNWKRRDQREVHQQLQNRYDELLKTRRGGF